VELSPKTSKSWAADHQSKILMKGFGEVGEKFFKKFSRFFDFLSVYLLSSL